MTKVIFMFQFTHPGRGATKTHRRQAGRTTRFNSRTPGGVRHVRGCDMATYNRFNSRTPGGVRQSNMSVLGWSRPFQFTHPGRGATSRCPTRTLKRLCFNSRTPGGVRLGAAELGYIGVAFQFTHPGRGATNFGSAGSRHSRCFNSRTPGGVRHVTEGMEWMPQTFQFTHPGRGATRRVLPLPHATMVSIHAPREGCDLMHAETTITDDSFNSRTPGGVRPRAATPPAPICGFNSRTPGGVRRSPASSVAVTPTFQFTHPGRGATSPRH